MSPTEDGPGSSDVADASFYTDIMGADVWRFYSGSQQTLKQAAAILDSSMRSRNNKSFGVQICYTCSQLKPNLHVFTCNM